MIEYQAELAIRDAALLPPATPSAPPPLVVEVTGALGAPLTPALQAARPDAQCRVLEPADLEARRGRAGDIATQFGRASSTSPTRGWSPPSRTSSAYLQLIVV